MSDEQRFEHDPLRSSRDRSDTRDRLQAWLLTTVGDDAATLGDFSSPSGSGMSSETLLFDATWGGETHELVARLAPSLEDTPVFASYDLDLQFRVLQLVRNHSAVPVPEPLWLELDASAIGSPFFVMGRLRGRVPADIPPYLMDGWLLGADAVQQRAAQDASVGILAELHTIDVSDHDVSFLELDSPGETPLRRLMAAQREYYEWVRGDRRHPLVEQAFEWLEANWPVEGPTVISWGDARIGNIMYAEDGFEPVAVLDWEMATLAPPEVDLGWMVFLHSFFQNIAEFLGMDGIPEFMRGSDVRTDYVARTGTEIQDLHWFEVFAGLRHAIIMSRIHDRMVRFGERDGWPEDVDEVVPHRNLLLEMMAR